MLAMVVDGKNANGKRQIAYDKIVTDKVALNMGTVQNGMK